MSRDSVMSRKFSILLQWFHEWERDREFYIFRPANETEMGPYLVPGMRPGRESRRALVPWINHSSNDH